MEEHTVSSLGNRFKIDAPFFVLAYLVKYGVEYWFDTRAEYQEIADAEAEATEKVAEIDNVVRLDETRRLAWFESKGLFSPSAMKTVEAMLDGIARSAIGLD